MERATCLFVDTSLVFAVFWILWSVEPKNMLLQYLEDRWTMLYSSSFTCTPISTQLIHLRPLERISAWPKVVRKVERRRLVIHFWGRSGMTLRLQACCLFAAMNLMPFFYLLSRFLFSSQEHQVKVHSAQLRPYTQIYFFCWKFQMGLGWLSWVFSAAHGGLVGWGKTLVSRTQGTKIATEELKGRVLEVAGEWQHWCERERIFILCVLYSQIWIDLDEIDVQFEERCI